MLVLAMRSQDAGGRHPCSEGRGHRGGNLSDFSVVLFRSYFMLVSEKNHVKALKNQWVLTRP
jgi:hypothetical protein